VNFSILTDKNTFEKNKRNIVGELYIKIDNFYFPSYGWSDIISSVLDMWMDNLISLIQSDRDDEIKELFFMDGPYYLRIIGIKDDNVVITMFAHDKQINQNPIEVKFNNILWEIRKIITIIEIDYNLKKEYCINSLVQKLDFLEKIASKNGYKI